MLKCARSIGNSNCIGGYQSINDLVAPEGRLARQRDLAYDLVSQIPVASCVKPDAAMYLFLGWIQKNSKLITPRTYFKNTVDTKVLLVQEAVLIGVIIITLELSFCLMKII